MCAEAAEVLHAGNAVTTSADYLVELCCQLGFFRSQLPRSTSTTSVCSSFLHWNSMGFLLVLLCWGLINFTMVMSFENWFFILQRMKRGWNYENYFLKSCLRKFSFLIPTPACTYNSSLPFIIHHFLFRVLLVFC